MGRRLLLFLTAALILAGSYFIVPMWRTVSGTPATLSAQPHESTHTKPAAPLGPTAPTVTTVAVTDAPGGGSLLGRPVDPTSLSDLPAYRPLDFGHHYISAVSPDGKLLVVVTWPNSYSVNGKLHLIDLKTWTGTVANLNIDDYADGISFGADGTALYWSIPTSHDSAHGMPRGYELYRYDLKTGQAAAITQLPSSFMPWEQRATAGRILIIGVPTDINNLTEDVPHVLVVDPATGAIMADVQVDGLKAGQFREEMPNATNAAGEPAWQYTMYRPGLAWDLERNLLYVAHADEDKVSVINLAKGTSLEQTPVPSAQSWLERAATWWTPAVEAKGGPDIGRRALISPDGKRLYVLNQSTEDGLLNGAILRVFATDGMREIGRLDELVTDFMQSPDGRSILVVKGNLTSANGFDSLISHDIYVLDAETLREVAHMQADQTAQLQLDGFSQDGRFAHMHGYTARWVEGSGWRDGRSTWQVLDLYTDALTASTETKGGFAALVHVFP